MDRLSLIFNKRCLALELSCGVCSAQYNHAFSFTYTLQNRQCEMLFTSVSGHLTDLDFPPSYRKWAACRPLDLYSAPIVKFVPEVCQP